ncbi:MAG: helix-turn-helix domain-containing protein [Clostridia bacterium]|nr:helix-turn-helix domain-containing protein [Clostridia bacterium]
MKISISQNIVRLRKHSGMTQEALAEALGVSFAAVSKWERGVATPELDTIVELADLFSISLDALLGYEMRANDLKSIVERIRGYSHTRDRDDGAIQEAEKALQRFPNHFEMVYQCALLYSVRGLDEGNQDYSRRSLELLQHACHLIDQNTREDVDEYSIRQRMAMEHMLLGENEKGLELLKKHNPCGLNNARIGMRLAMNCDRPDEAIPYLSEALLDFTSMHHHIVYGYLNAFIKKKQFEQAEALLAWALAFYPGLKPEGKTCHLEKGEALLWAIRALVRLELHQQEQAKEDLRMAKQIALHFDASPVYDATGMRFVDLGKPATSHDDLGETAMKAVDEVIAEQEHELLTQMWEAVKSEEEGSVHSTRQRLALTK